MSQNHVVPKFSSAVVHDDEAGQKLLYSACARSRLRLICTLEYAYAEVEPQGTRIETKGEKGR